MIKEETCSGDVQGFTKPIDSKIDKRPSFKEFLSINNKKKHKRKGKNVLQKQKDKRDSGVNL